jgi:hypothetical protein
MEDEMIDVSKIMKPPQQIYPTVQPTPYPQPVSDAPQINNNQIVPGGSWVPASSGTIYGSGAGTSTPDWLSTTGQTPQINNGQVPQINNAGAPQTTTPGKGDGYWYYDSPTDTAGEWVIRGSARDIELSGGGGKTTTKGGGGTTMPTGTVKGAEDTAAAPEVDPWGNLSSYDPTYGQVNQFNNFPVEWDVASNVLGNFAQTGMPTTAPAAWGTAENAANLMSQTGMPVDQMPMYQASLPVVQQDIRDQIMQAAETAGFRGNRYNTSTARTAQDIAGRNMNQLGQSLMSNQLQAGEAARQRQLGTIPLLQQIGMGQAGLTEEAKARAMSAAGQLGGLGNYYAQLPMQAAETGMKLGTTMQGTQQSALDRLYQAWQGQQAYNNPYMQYIQGMSSLTGNMVPQTYQPSSGSQALGSFASILPFLFLL